MNKKGLIGAAKISLILIFLIISGFFLYQSIIGFAESSATIWTTDVYGNPQTDFAPYTIVYIHGSNFLKHRKVDVSVTRPDNVLEKGFTFSDYYGNFVYEYQLNGIEGLYNVLASDKENTAQITFTDASIDFTQCANDDNNDDVKDDCEWINGALNQNNAIYREGNVVPHRLFHQIADAGTHTIRFRYQFTKGDIYAYDFISTPDLTQSGADFNSCGDLPGWISSSVCSSLFSGALSANVPSDTFDAVASRENPTSRTILIGGVSSPSVSIVGHDPSTSCFQNCGDSHVDIDITFTTSSPNTIVAIWFGGHLAQAADPDAGGPLEGWGTGFGASSISGAPFHMRYMSLDGESVGTRDNQIQPGAILPPPECITNEDCDDANPCIRDECINNTCVYTPEPLSTSCELDDNKCTIDHCDGAGSCVWKENVVVPPAEECKSFYCDPSDGSIKEDYTDYPESTFCELDDNLCTLDHCNGVGSCVNYGNIIVPEPEECKSFFCNPSTGEIEEDYTDYPLSTYCELDDNLCTVDHCDGLGSCIKDYDIDCSYLDDDCQEGVCNPSDGECYPDYFDYSTFCDNGLYCDGPEHCDGYGACVNLGPPIDCSYLNNDCQEGVCDEVLDDCVPDYTDYPWSTPCELDEDLCTLDHCDGEGTCIWKEDVYVPPAEECVSYYCEPLDGEVYSIYEDYSTVCELDEDLCTHDHCDGFGVCVWNYDEPVPESEECKSFYCDPSDGSIKEDYTDYPESTFCELDQDPCTHDHCDGYGSCVNYYNISAPSAPNKTVGEPKLKWYPTTDIEDPDRTIFYPWIVDKCWNGLEDEIECWKVTLFTPITLSCEDSVDNESLCFKVELDANDTTQKYCEDIEGQYNETSGYCCVDSEIELFYFGEETEHNLEAYCVNACGISEKDEEKFKVEGTAFEISLYKKWNLISVPFTLFNDDPEFVFEEIADNIVSVWMYDSECGGDGWCVWTPEGGGELDIKPGWGYWILARNDTILLIGGSLFSPATIPPNNNLQAGWNLIGYYGTEWQDYQTELDTCGYHYEYGNYIYCALNSLVDTQVGFPRWSSLWGYDNCGNDITHWNNLGVCESMFAGKGYWIEMDIADGYAPATNCIWNSEFMCA